MPTPLKNGKKKKYPKIAAALKGNKRAVGNAGGPGVPTKYGPHVITKTKAYLERVKQSHVKSVTFHELPQIAGLALDLDVDKVTIYTWAKLHPEFSQLVSRLQAWQEKLLTEGGMTGLYVSNMARFVLNAKHGYTETTNHKVGELEKDDLDELPNDELERIARGG